MQSQPSKRSYRIEKPRMANCQVRRSATDKCHFLGIFLNRHNCYFVPDFASALLEEEGRWLLAGRFRCEGRVGPSILPRCYGRVESRERIIAALNFGLDVTGAISFVSTIVFASYT